MWSPQHYITEGKKKGLPDDLLDTAVHQIEQVVLGGINLPSILSLNHLAVRTSVSYPFLRRITQRADHDAYRKFSIRKRSGGRRFIHVPDPALAHVQRWINAHILTNVPVHKCSFAFAPGSSILKCASRHCGAQWLIKMDITGFFESISEIQVYRVFEALGYQPLVAFELARLVTIAPTAQSPRKDDPVWKVNKTNSVIPTYSEPALGYLPQGAPTSPMLSNLVMRDIDEKLSVLSSAVGVNYTRYSDDLTFSTRHKKFDRNKARSLIDDVQKIIAPAGFRPQHRKTTVVPPGSRKVVLGLLVDGQKPRLRREFKDNLRHHIHYLEKFGPLEHAKARNFHTIWGMKCHIRGLIDYANMVDSSYSGSILKRFEMLDWPF